MKRNYNHCDYQKSDVLIGTYKEKDTIDTEQTNR